MGERFDRGAAVWRNLSHLLKKYPLRANIYQFSFSKLFDFLFFKMSLKVTWTPSGDGPRDIRWEGIIIITIYIKENLDFRSCPVFSETTDPILKVDGSSD